MDTTCIYKFQDPIENLQIKITLRKHPIIDPTITINPNPTLENVSSSSTSMTRSKSMEMKPLDKPKRFKSTSKVFRWQEKVFSRREVEYYSDLDSRTRLNRGSSNEQDHPMLSNLSSITRRHLEEYQEQNFAGQQEGKGELKGEVLCSLVDEDQHPKIPNPTHPSDGSSSLLSTNLWLPLRDQEIATGTASFTTANATVMNKPVKGLHRHLHETPFRTFTIIAAMRKRTQQNVGGVDEINPNQKWEGNDYVLCTIRAYDNGTLEMRPGFTKDINKPYSLPTDDIHTAYEYFIENYTPFPIVRSPIPNVAAVIPERPFVGAPFVKGPSVSSNVRIHIHAEIIKAKGFPASPLFVEYVVDLHDTWRHYDPDEPVSENGEPDNTPLNAFSQSGNAKPDPNDPTSHITHFGFPFEIHAEGPEQEHYPKIYFVVHTQDYWDRHQVLGYGYTIIPHTAGRFETEISMWRPMSTARDQMRSFFIGAPPELQSLKYISSTKTENYVLPDRPQKAINKYGFKTVSSGGSLFVRLDCAFQRKPEEPESDVYVGGQQVSDWGRAPNAAVMNALARAKQRIEMIKNMKKEQ